MCSTYFPLNVFVLSVSAMFFNLGSFFFHCFIWGSLSADIACMTNLPRHFQTSSFSVRQQHNTTSNVCTMWFWSSTHCESYQTRLNTGNIHYYIILNCKLLWIMHIKQPFHQFRPFPLEEAFNASFSFLPFVAIERIWSFLSLKYYSVSVRAQGECWDRRVH